MNLLVKARIGLLIAIGLVVLVIAGWTALNHDLAETWREPGTGRDFQHVDDLDPVPALIRLHVVANSDAEEDQALKRAVRDAILRKISPLLALSKSLEESRRMLIDLQPEMERIAREVVAAWGHDDQVRSEYGHFQFPTKSYGSLVLPAGTYEAVRILIGEAQGSNWWCVLFPPLCIIDVDGEGDDQARRSFGSARAATTVASPKGTQGGDDQGELSSKEIKFYFWEKIKRWKGK